MKKGHKKLLVVAVLLLLVCVGIGTYAIYRSSASGNASVSTAAWVVEVNDTSIVTSNSFTVGNINWSTHRGKNGKIAPGDTGTITLEIDATGSEVDVDYTVQVGTILVDGVANTNTGFTVTNTGENASGTIAYSTTENAMKKTITLNVTWLGDDNDDASKDANDIAMSNKPITIPVTVTAKQNLTN